MEIAAGICNEEIQEETYNDYEAGKSDGALELKDKILRETQNKTSI